MGVEQWHGEDCHLAVWVQPRASREGVVGLRGEEIRISLNAPPVDGAANQALVRFMARELGVAKGRVIIVAGERSRSKRLCLKNLSRQALQTFFFKWGLGQTVDKGL
ncbi:MAG: YggU family protein [Magnetococcales bacterium]|nr:YggU family protein [Magnetococcales bacterium]